MAKTNQMADIYIDHYPCLVRESWWEKPAKYIYKALKLVFASIILIINGFTLVILAAAAFFN